MLIWFAYGCTLTHLFLCFAIKSVGGRELSVLVWEGCILKWHLKTCIFKLLLIKEKKMWCLPLYEILSCHSKYAVWHISFFKQTFSVTISWWLWYFYLSYPHKGPIQRWFVLLCDWTWPILYIAAISQCTVQAQSGQWAGEINKNGNDITSVLLQFSKTLALGTWCTVAVKWKCEHLATPTLKQKLKF